jgi:hypothetical protein
MPMSRTRVPIRFERKFSAASEKGKLFGWLEETYDVSMTDMIIFAVKVLFEPLCLAESGESEVSVKKAIAKSRRIFEEKMRGALEPFFDSEEDAVFENGRSDPVSVRLLPAEVVENPLIIRPMEPRQPLASAEFEDDFELDESKIFDETTNFGGISDE